MGYISRVTIVMAHIKGLITPLILHGPPSNPKNPKPEKPKSPKTPKHLKHLNPQRTKPKPQTPKPNFARRPKHKPTLSDASWFCRVVMMVGAVVVVVVVVMVVVAVMVVMLALTFCPYSNFYFPMPRTSPVMIRW